MSYNKTKIADGGNFQTVWLKPKTKTSKKGEDYEVLQGSIDMGGGKMLKIYFYADQKTIEKDGKELFPVQVSKWKSDRVSSSRGNRKSNW